MSNGWFAWSGVATNQCRIRSRRQTAPGDGGDPMFSSVQALPVLLLAAMIVFIPLLSDGPP